MKVQTIQGIAILIVVVTGCACLVSVFAAPFVGVKMPPELVAFVTNLILLFFGGAGGAGLTVLGQKQGEQQERLRILGIPKER